MFKTYLISGIVDVIILLDPFFYSVLGNVLVDNEMPILTLSIAMSLGLVFFEVFGIYRV